MEKYDPSAIEPKWQEYWAKHPELYAAKEDSDKPKYYCLDMFPYPSGDGLHVGHVESYTATDIVSRFMRMNGKNVLHPQGWDAFGLPAENFAIKHGTHPDITTHKNIANFTRQIKSLGMSYDWSREIDTSSPEYYKWTQWIFLLLYRNGLAYKKMGKVNWCPSCQTVLANEQVEDGVCERCKSQVVQKDLEQWYFKITDFIESAGNVSGLIDGLDKADWPDSTKAAQRNWIGKSEGAEFDFGVKDSEEKITVYTTRIDTVFGVTYVVVGPEHPLIGKLRDRISNIAKVEAYAEASKKKTDLERMEAKEKTGVKLEGIMAVNPFNGEEVPVFVADYVLSHYGTGAVMAVPAHDERDFEFAKKYDLLIKYVIVPHCGSYKRPWSGDDWMSYETSEMLKSQVLNDDGNRIIKSILASLIVSKKASAYDGILVDSGEYDFMNSAEAREKMIGWLEEEGIGRKKVNYKLRDWLVSRQRYWGAPIPIIYCEHCGAVPVPDGDLPVMLPTDVDFKPTGESPLMHSKTFHDVACPICGAKARRESDTMDTFVCSSWYYLRYSDPKNAEAFASRENIGKWLPVDLYVGGAEHSVLHLLYARFFTKALCRLGYVGFDEPFSKLRHQGIILAEDGRKMSKSFGNVINPDEVVKEYGADALRIFEMFMGPIEAMKPWNTKGIVGTKRFLEKAWRIGDKVSGSGSADDRIRPLVHKTIKKVGEDIENFRFNTAVSQMMVLANAMDQEERIAKDHFESLLKVLSPFAPHIAEELWNRLGNEESIFLSEWPEYDPELAKDEEIEMVVQVNGKVRDRIRIGAETDEEEMKKLALGSDKVKAHIEGKEIRKIVAVKGKLVSIAV